MSGGAAEPTGSLATAIAHAWRLMRADPAMADAQARAILEAAPGHPEGRLLLGVSARRQGREAEALEVLEPLAREQGGWAAAQLELGLTLAALGRTAEAIDALERAAAIDPSLPQAWRALGDQRTLTGDAAGADQAYARQIKASVNDPVLADAAMALADNKLAVAEHALRGFLKRHPTDVAAMRMLAEVGARLGRHDDAEALLTRALELAPGFTAARHNLATVLHRQTRGADALAHVDLLLRAEPDNPAYRSLKAAALNMIGEYAEAVEHYEAVLKAYPQQPKAWMSYGHTLKTLGRAEDAVAAYRKSIALLPQLGEAWWSLANLKTYRFSDDDLTAMRTQLGASDLADEDRFHLDFALGKALEDRREYAPSFEHYARANALRRQGLDYSAEDTSEHVRRSKAVLTASLFAAREGWGSPAPDPIFIVGLPRSGSTLIEQILASHSMVEGTMELPDVIAMAKRLGGKRKPGEPSAYPEALLALDEGAMRALGEEYLERTRVQRKLGRPRFIDKMPNNWRHVGLIAMMLPNAKIIDARRHPLGCCLSNFKQHFARGQAFSYGLDDLGRYYADYVDLMAHIDAVLPGRVHRVFYEAMVADQERQVRALLDHCHLPFEQACLRFWENERAVRTASSEQVRQPIFTEGRDQWRAYEPWLDPLKQTLGSVLEAYAETPAAGGASNRDIPATGAPQQLPIA